MKVVKESTKGTKMKYAKTLKENLQLLKEGWMPDSETISWLKDYLRDVKNGEGYVDIDKVVYDADIELNKDFSKNKKDLADYIKRIDGASILKEDVEQKIVIHTKNGKVDSIEKGTYMPNGVFIRNAGVSFDKGFIGMDPEEAKGYLVKYSRYDPRVIMIEGCKKVQEATSNLREGFGELEVYTSFGPGIGVQIYPSRNGELTAHVGYVSNGSGNGTFKKELKTETELKAIDEIKIADLKQIEKVLKKHLDALDSDLQKLFKQYGYK